MSTRGDTIVKFTCAECGLVAEAKLRELRESGWFHDKEGDELCRRCADELGICSEAQYLAKLAYCTRRNFMIRIFTCDYCGIKIEGLLKDITQNQGWRRVWRSRGKVRVQVDLCSTCSAREKSINPVTMRIFRVRAGDAD